jgi:hypothetical protein
MGASVCPERVVSESTPARERSRVVVEAVENLIALLKR